jgi:hypothetical protein
VRQDFASLGARGFELLEGLLAGRPMKRFTAALPPLVIRDSAARPPQ